MRIGVLSDTHGRLHPRVMELFAGVDHILHAGDIGKPEIITELRTLAPLSAVFGNVDGFPLAGQFAERVLLSFSGTAIFMTHVVQDRTPSGLYRLLREAGAETASVIIYGHTHEACIDEVEQLLLFNPGSAGPARFNMRPSVGLLTLAPGGAAHAEIITL